LVGGPYSGSSFLSNIGYFSSLTQNSLDLNLTSNFVESFKANDPRKKLFISLSEVSIKNLFKGEGWNFSRRKENILLIYQICDYIFYLNQVDLNQK
jgi:hypothetical protein